MGGLALLGALPVGITSEAFVLAIFFAILGSLLPDLDARESRLSNVQIGGVTPMKPLAHVLNRRLGHRGAMHSLMALVALSVLVALPLALLLDPFTGIGLVLGYLSHLLLDAGTRSGIQLFWPDAQRVWVLPPRLRITTGSRAEDALLLLLSLATATFLLLHLFQISLLPNDPSFNTTAS